MENNEAMIESLAQLYRLCADAPNGAARAQRIERELRRLGAKELMTCEPTPMNRKRERWKASRINNRS